MALANPFIFIWLFGKRKEGSWKFWKLTLTYSRCFFPSLIWWKQEKAINIRTYVPYCFLWRAIRMLSWINGFILVSYVGYGIKGAVPYNSLSCLASFLCKRCVRIKCYLLCCQKIKEYWHERTFVTWRFWSVCVTIIIFYLLDHRLLRFWNTREFYST